MTPAIHVRDLRKRYRKVNALDGVSFDAARGEIFGLALLGLLRKDPTGWVQVTRGLREHLPIVSYDIQKDHALIATADEHFFWWNLRSDAGEDLGVSLPLAYRIARRLVQRNDP